MAQIRRRDVRVQVGNLLMADFRITCNLYYGFKESEKMSAIEIYNKKIEPIVAMPRFTPISVFSDYFRDGTMPPKVFEGYIVDVEEEQETNYSVVIIHVLHNTVRNRTQTIINISNENPTPIRSIIQKVASDMGFMVQNVSVIPDVKLENFTFNGSPLDLFEMILNPHNIQWTENGNSIYFYDTAIATGRGNTTRQINRNTGMILSPGREDLGTYYTVEEARYISVKTLFDPTYLVGEKLSIQSRTYNGECIISTIHNQIDNWQGDFISNLACRVI